MIRETEEKKKKATNEEIDKKRGRKVIRNALHCFKHSQSSVESTLLRKIT